MRAMGSGRWSFACLPLTFCCAAWFLTGPVQYRSLASGLGTPALQHMSSGKCKLNQWATTTHLLEWPKSKTLTIPNAGKDVEQHKLSFIAGGNTNWCGHSGRRLTASYKTKHPLTIWSSNHAPQYLPNELKTYVHTKTCTRMFIAALFIIAKTWKQPRCPSVGEWRNKLWYNHSMEYYSALKRNKLSSHEKSHKNLKWILLSEQNQYEKVWYQLHNILEKAKRSIVARKGGQNTEDF